MFAGASVTIGNTAATGVAVTSSSEIAATTPAHGAGTVAVVVTNPDGQGGTLAAGFTFVGVPTFTDVPIEARVTRIKAAHFTELRQLIGQLRARYGLMPVSWTDAGLVPGVTVIKAVHLTELRTALDAVYSAAGRTAPPYGTPTITAGSTEVAKGHIDELRQAILAIW